jgi:pyruvate,water dikinase
LTSPSDALRVDYLCGDGSPFPVVFADRADVELRWAIDREHAPTARSPLADSVARAGAVGTERAYAECGLNLPSTLRPEPPRANGYEYYVDGQLPAAEQQEFESGLARLVRDHGGAWGVWENLCLPRVLEACAWLGAPPLRATFRAMAERRAYAWSHTSVAGVVARRDLRAVAALCEPAFGDRATFLAYELAQGFENETVAADAELARIAHMNAESPDALTARAEFLASYGGRAGSWSIDHPTLNERPDVLDAQLRLIRRTSRPGVARADAPARRRRLADQIRAELRADADRARFDRRLARLEAFVPIREARARWQLVASGALRARVRARGGELVAAGALDDVDDVFFLTPLEFDAPDGDLRSLVRVRRREHERWSAVTPPVNIGDLGDATPEPAIEGVLQGTPGARGVAEGTARVLLDLVDAERLEPGDILVTTMTAPPWTPLFAIVAAVVTDSGDALSHVAIAAREYGIPCVVGTHDATRRIEDGTSITVDGDAGIVQFHA